MKPLTLFEEEGKVFAKDALGNMVPIDLGAGSGEAAPAAWQDVTSKVLFGFNGLRHWPGLGVGGKFEALAKIDGKNVELKLYGEIGTGASFPSESAWFFYMLAPELMAGDRWVGSMAMYNKGQGSLQGFCRFLNKADATPPYWPLCLFHAPMNPGAGYLTSIYPWKWAERVGSWFLAQISYEAA